MTATIYHNPRCSKSREALALLRDRGVEPVVVEYLQTPPDAAALQALLAALGLRPRALLRRQEPEYAELGLADPLIREDALIDAMVAHLRLFVRLFVVFFGLAVLGW